MGTLSLVYLWQNMNYNLLLFLLLTLVNKSAYAYIGLVPLLPLIGNIVLSIFIFIIFVIGFLFYPISKYLKTRKNKSKKK